ncbi:alpha/beta hydrolase [Bacillus solitudinis]|uniref:alpha/beta hydrolase n=1 Tax=Bacillus solitudinis TaxID=2014074 RepID=UPI001D0D7F33|nr:alpha/beta hydrolase [Bacillus solitudinis]
MLVGNEKQTGISTINKTLLTANLIDGFWERWIVHGVDRSDLATMRSAYLTKETWVSGWREIAERTFSEAGKLERINNHREAEYAFRTAALYYQLVQWLLPEREEAKIEWLNISLSVCELADRISTIKTKYAKLPIENHYCFGRIRIPLNPKAVIVIVNPFDSTKEELFTYEMDFVNNGYITVSFDGPGQGQTYAYQGLLGSTLRWQQFIDELIEYAYLHFPGLNIHLFGTSSGASWAIYGSCNPNVSKVIAVSPAFISEDKRLPDYFIERTRYVLEKGENQILPSFEQLSFQHPVYLIHGKKDVMVSTEDIYNLYKELPAGKKLIEYEDEGHCCNFKLPEIRQLAMEWLQEGTVEHDSR